MSTCQLRMAQSYHLTSAITGNSSLKPSNCCSGLAARFDTATAFTESVATEEAHGADRSERKKVIVVGAPDAWKSKGEVTVAEEGTKTSESTRKVELHWHAGGSGKAAWAVVRDPKVAIGKGWRIDFS